jgi:hypothetical protein
MPRKQNRQVVIRMTEDDFGILKAQVKKSQLPQAEFMRRCINGKKIIVVENGRETLAQLSRVSGNLNQIAKWCNSGYANGDLNYEIKKCSEELMSIWPSLKKLIQKGL